MKRQSVIRNIIMLYGYSTAKIIFPLLTLPYLTRVLSVETYGVVAYVKSIMTYMQLVIDFGFILSGTKEIVLAKEDNKRLPFIIGDILIARLILAGISFVVLCFLIIAIPIFRINITYTLLSFLPILMTIFLFDYVFRGFEKMQVITSRFVIMKGFSTVLTFLLVKSDSNLMLIPIIDIGGTILAIALVYYEINKLGTSIAFTGVKSALKKLKESAVYFTSNIATTVGGALSTILIGTYMNASDIAYWGASLQLVNAVLTLYNPIVEGVYPNIVKNHDYIVVKKIMIIFMPIIICGCLFILFFSNTIVSIAFGYRYETSAYILKGLLPVFFFAFPAQLLGWPMLGTIGKAKQVSYTTIIYGLFNFVGLVIIIFFDIFTLYNVVILRSLSEFILFLGRFFFCLRYKNTFNLHNKTI